ncbi:MAG: hypothetical protein UHN02_03195, partial [Acutalibacteraceae bacterium]|nr:hypothetical protein [Acutalibacteraceae bacterium]
MKDGSVTSANGWYVSGTNDIYIDLNAGQMGEVTMLWTAAHEISHFIKEWSPKKWKAMADFIMKAYSEQKDVSIESMLNKQIAKIKHRPDAKSKTASQIRDEAYEELVSDALSEMLVDGSVVNVLAEIKQKDKKLWQKIKEAVQDLLKRWGEILGVYEGRTLESEEAKVLKGMEDTFKQLQKMFADAFADANATFEAIGETKNTTTEGDVKLQTRNVNGNQVVWIEQNILKENKGLPIHQFIANFIAEHIGEVYTIIESGQKVYIGEDLPSEYTQSKYTKKLLRNNPNIIKAKNKASANLGEMIEIATNRRWEKTKHIENKDAKYGMYRYDTRFGLPIMNANGEVVGANVYNAELVIRNALDGKKYLYDIVGIKKDIASSDWLSKKTTSATEKSVGQKNNISTDSISQTSKKSQIKLSDRGIDTQINQSMTMEAETTEEIKFSERTNNFYYEYLEEMPVDDYNKLTIKKPIKVSKDVYAAVNSARTQLYGDIAVEDIPIIDIINLGEYGVLNSNDFYFIRNADKI